MEPLLLIIGLLMFVGLVVAHEFGHFIAARRNGVEVEEFGIGFPPRAKVLAKRSGTIFSLNWLPLGGFVKLKGEHDESREPGSYGAASLAAKVKILVAGVAMNFAVAALIFTVLAFVGMPKVDLKGLPFYDRAQFTVPADTVIVSTRVHITVMPDSPAARAGLKNGDQITRVGDSAIPNAAVLPVITERYKGQTVYVEYVRNGQSGRVSVALNRERGQTGYLGVAPADLQLFRSTWSAPLVGVVTTAQFTEVTLRGLGYVVQNLIAGQAARAGEAVGGPVAIFHVLSETTAIGALHMLFVVALISISLGVMNALPIPALDGGRLFVTLLFRAARRPLRRELEEWIHGTGFVFLIVLIIVITIADIRRLF